MCVDILMILLRLYYHGFDVSGFFFFQAEDGIRDAQESRGLGDVYKRQILFCFCPEKPFQQRCLCRAYCTPWFPKALARFLARHAIATIEQDRTVWENKLTCNPKMLVAKDGPFAAYGSWVKQFYSESSVTWDDSSLDW
eukprot:TRINITY_DN11945_c0_g1_i2.p1 TRINITY_DN11945_c0_g1~~TRINITY_DN11945_c0_g1_i2.p1  ORF type:complete len:139 (+),score=29.70 TRINITY_DN11945_c0_g1_i2:34-450(+)